MDPRDILETFRFVLPSVLNSIPLLVNRCQLIIHLTRKMFTDLYYLRIIIKRQIEGVDKIGLISGARKSLQGFGIFNSRYYAILVRV